MASSKAATVDDYLAELPAERRAEIERVRDVIRSHLPDGYTESMNWGMISYEIPLSRYPSTYNRQPLSFAALAAQKNHLALYLHCVYQDPKLYDELLESAQATGRKLDMGKSCLRFNRADDLPLDVIGRIIASSPPERFIAQYEQARAR